MTSKTVKCANCNVVINELLAFVTNVLDYMDEESIHQLVTSSFSVESIASAKSLLFDSIPSAKKKPCRRGDGKKRMSRDLDDIICLMKATNAEMFPIFVAKDLHLVPSVGFDHIDCTRLLKDIVGLQRQVNLLQEKAVTVEMFEILKHEIDNMKHASIVDHFPTNSYVNKRRGACLRDNDSYELNSGPVGLQYVPIKSTQASAVEGNGHSTPTRITTRVHGETESVSFQCAQSDAMEEHGLVEAPTEVPKSSSESLCETRLSGAGKQSVSGMASHVLHLEATERTVVSNAPVFATGVSAGNIAPGAISSANNTAVSFVAAPLNNQHEFKENRIVMNCTQFPEENGEWQIVQSKTSKRYKLIGQKGRASTAPDIKFKAANVMVPLFISNVSKETSDQDIISYIKDRTNETVSLKMIKIKSNKKYNAYKLFVTKTKLNLFLNDEFWPDGITFRRFVHFMYKNKQDDRKVIVS